MLTLDKQFAIVITSMKEDDMTNIYILYLHKEELGFFSTKEKAIAHRDTLVKTYDYQLGGFSIKSVTLDQPF